MRQVHFLVAASGILVTTLFCEIAIGRKAASDIASSAPVVSAVPSASVGLGSAGAVTPDIDALKQAAAVALNRPLFSHDRRPGEQAPRSPDLPTATMGLPRLSGVIVGPDGRRAVFTDPGGKAHGLGEGEAMGGYIIRVIQPGMVVVSGPDGERVLHPSYAKTNRVEAVP